MPEARKRILMVLDHSFPPDVRVENEARSLIEAGYTVGLLAIGPDDRPAREEYRGLHIFRDRIPASVRNKMRGLAGTIPVYSHYLRRRIVRLHEEFRFDAIHAHDLYLFGGSLRAAGLLGVSIIGDLHENWVEALRGYEWSNRFPARALISFRRWERLERRWTAAVDRLVVVIEESAERNIRNGVSPERVVIVPNTLNVEEFESLDSGGSVGVQGEGRKSVLYVGGIDRHRGLDTVIEAMPSVVRSFPGVRLHIVGEGRTRSRLQSRCAELGIEQAVYFHGWQPLARVKRYIAESDLCLVPHHRTPHTDATIPHKLFQYMYMRRPVVVSDCRPLERIVREADCGDVFRSGNADHFVRVLSGLLLEPGDWPSMGERGRQAVLSRHNWRTTVKPLVAAYSELIGRPSGDDAEEHA